MSVCGVALALWDMPNLPSVTKSKLAVHSEIDTQPLNLSWLDRLVLSEIRLLAGKLGIMTLFFWITHPFADSLLFLFSLFASRKVV